jgi:hypothetical protein
VKVRSGYGRSNVPVIYTDSGGVAEWSVAADFAVRWKTARTTRDPGEDAS